MPQTKSAAGTPASLLFVQGRKKSRRDRGLEPCSALALTPRTADGMKKPVPRRPALAVHPSVIKRHRQSLKRRARNIEAKSRLRTLIKKTRQAIDSKQSEDVSSQLRAVDKALGKAVSRGIIKRNTASRWLSRLSRSAASDRAAS